MSTHIGARSQGWAYCLVACVVVVGCSTEDRFHPKADAGAAGGGGSKPSSGTGGRAQPSAGSGSSAPTNLGAACMSDADCGRLLCDREIKQSVNVNGAPNGGQVDFSLFPGGSCTPVPLAAFDSTGSGRSCDPTEPRGSQGCGSEGVCLVENVQNKTQVGCRKGCEPSAASSGCDRKGYTCDFSDRACIEGCRSDTECRIQLVDSDNDGDPDSTVYEKDSRATCDEKTARCTHPGGSQPEGGSCMNDDDCAADAACITADTALAGHRFPGGLCTKAGCEVKGRECGGGTTCEPLRGALDSGSTDPLCLTRCTVGAEPAELQKGASGHGMGCRMGFRCQYNGGTGAQGGVCVGGEYNGVSMNNIGSACMKDSECYSPFGAGRCLHYTLPDNKSSNGICTLADCNAPGIAKDICGTGNECVGTSGDQTLCMHDCAKATECPAGFACTDDDGDMATPKVCFPVCETAMDCRSNERCQMYTGFNVGACVLQ